MKPIAIVVISLSLLTCQPALAANRQLTTSEKKIITDAFGRALKDPKSAEYTFPPVSLAELGKRPKIAYCFSYNARNAFGGFVGHRTIVSMLTVNNGNLVAFEYVTGLTDYTPALRAITNDLCAGFGFRFGD